jgi:hypothetical protein
MRDAVLGLTKIIKPDRVRVLEPLSELCFPVEPLHALAEHEPGKSTSATERPSALSRSVNRTSRLPISC